MSESHSQIHLYWATGCTSCLRAKEFLERNETPFVSHNVIEDRSLLDEMAERGMPQHVPIVRRGADWANAQELSAVAEIAGIEHEADPLPVDELRTRLNVVFDALERALEALSDDDLVTDIPNRPRSVGEIVYHAFSIPESFLEHEDGSPLKSYKPEPAWANRSTAALSTYGRHVRVRTDDWFDAHGADRDWSATVDVYYGTPSVHEFFERTVWHAGQHTRQLEWMLVEEFGAEIDPVDPSVWEGLPMPEKVWDAL